jgi:hypothetical protein
MLTVTARSRASPKCSDLRASAGFAELASLDTNADGVIDAADADFAKLQVWQDLDQDHVTDADELKTLTEFEIESLSLNATDIAVHTDAGHDLITEVSFTRTDGTTGTGTVYEALFNANQTQTEYRGDMGIADWASALPILWQGLERSGR